MRLIVPLVLAGLAACAPAAPNITAVPVAFAGGAAYTCDDGQTIRVERRAGSLGIMLGDGTPLDLPRVQTLDGTRYAADGWVWFESGPTAILTQQGGQANCRIAAGPRPAPAAPRATSTLDFPPNIAPNPPRQAPGIFVSPDLDF